MPDLLHHSVTKTGNTIQVSIPEYVIAGQVVDSQTQETVLASYSVHFPQVLASATQAQLEALLTMIVRAIIQAETGF